MSEQFDYAPLFSKAAPQQGRWATSRARYDFAVAYPDPESIPIEGLWEGLRDAIREEGRSLALYPNAQGHEGVREMVAEKLARDRDIKVTKEDIALGHGSDPANAALPTLVQCLGDDPANSRRYSWVLRICTAEISDPTWHPCC